MLVSIVVSNPAYGKNSSRGWFIHAETTRPRTLDAADEDLFPGVSLAAVSAMLAFKVGRRERSHGENRKVGRGAEA